MGDPRIDSLHDPYEDQLSAARFKAERDAARQEADKSLMDAMTWEIEAEGMADELVHIEVENKRLGHLVWRLQNRLAKAHRRERNLRKGMREWREKAIGGPVRTVSAYDLLSEGEREVLRIWPRYEDCEPVLLGDRVEYRRGTCVVESVRLYIGGGVSVYGNDSGKQVVVTEQAFRDPVERVDAKVPAADGEPLEVGQTVWDTDAEADTPLTVVEVSSDLVRCEYTWKDGKTYRPCYPPDQLTHQRPDSWKRIEEDATLSPEVYCHRNGIDISQKDGTEIFLADTVEPMARDLVRRCREVAERERGE